MKKAERAVASSTAHTKAASEAAMQKVTSSKSLAAWETSSEKWGKASVARNFVENVSEYVYLLCEGHRLNTYFALASIIMKENKVRESFCEPSAWTADQTESHDLLLRCAILHVRELLVNPQKCRSMIINDIFENHFDLLYVCNIAHGDGKIAFARAPNALSGLLTRGASKPSHEAVLKGDYVFSNCFVS